jgi:hypothetical protein
VVEDMAEGMAAEAVMVVDPEVEALPTRGIAPYHLEALRRQDLTTLYTVN